MTPYELATAAIVVLVVFALGMAVLSLRKPSRRR